MKILIVGGGGREHAMAWHLVKYGYSVYMAEGNAGTGMRRNRNMLNLAIPPNDIPGLIQVVQTENIGLTIVGPEVPLVNGIVDEFQERGLMCFGPSKAAARIEGSKAYMKDFLKKYNIPSATYATYSNVAKALVHIQHNSTYPVVIKTNGLAAGKGVIIAYDEMEAINAIEAMMVDKKFGEAGESIVIEDFLDGEEASFIVMTDGKTAVPLATSQDYKPIYPGGPNTGGMGAFSPSPLINDVLHDKIMDDIITPTLAGMREEGHPYVGFLYAGLMISDGYVKVLEFNCRCGDPETQPIMMRLKTDLSQICKACIQGTLDSMPPIKWDLRHAVNVVLAAEGYPGEYRTGDIIHGLEAPTPDNVELFHAGTQYQGSHIVTGGGRVLSVCALGHTLEWARHCAYQQVQQISWDGMYHRDDIALRT